MPQHPSSSAPRPAPKPEPVKPPLPIIHQGKVDTSKTAVQRGWTVK